MDLFRHAAQKDRSHEPVAERMRPASIEEFVGQGHVLGEGKLLLRVLQEGALPSLILWGPPGSGKTTLAKLLAKAGGARFSALSAVQAGIKDLREEVARAEDALYTRKERTVLFVDEIHRFNKSQQDALLPQVENGIFILIGATTENPSFEVNAALLSRCRVVRLEALTDADLLVLIERTIADKTRGLGKYSLLVPPPVAQLLARESGGDARRLLNTLEVAASITPPSTTGQRTLTKELVEEALQRKTLLYDKAGDEHYGVISAFIKSMRGSDPDAAVYYLARMLEAGEDPVFVCRRMVIFASEDVGNADPLALGVAVAALDSVRLIGLPEGVLPLTQAVTYLAAAPKSNSAVTAYAEAKRLVREYGALPVPAKLRNAVTSLAKEMGHGAGYQYPHNFESGYVKEAYLPDAIAEAKIYTPSQHGAEAKIAERLAKLREEG